MNTGRTKSILLFSVFSLCALVSLSARADAGQRLEITTGAKLQGSDAEAILHTLVGDQGAAQAKEQVTVRLERRGENSTHLQFDVSGSLLPGDSADRIRAMFPALKSATISLVATDGTPLPPLPPNPDDLSTPEQIAAFKQKVQAQLAAEGKTGTVEVLVQTGADGKKTVKVEVKAEKDK